MAQAERITTAIRELMSRGRPSKSTNPVRVAHSGLIAALPANVPHLIHSDAHCEAPEDRAVDATAETAMHENWRVS